MDYILHHGRVDSFGYSTNVAIFALKKEEIGTKYYVRNNWRCVSTLA